MFVLFNEPQTLAQLDDMNQLFLNTEANFGKSKSLKLTLNRNLKANSSLVPYIEFIEFDIKHILHAEMSSDRIKSNIKRKLELCRNYVEEEERRDGELGQIVIRASFGAILGQFVRFYSICPIVFMALIVQFYDVLTLSIEHKISLRVLEEYRSKLIFHRFHSMFGQHLALSLLLTIIVNLFQIKEFHALLNLIDPDRAYLIENDYELIKYDDEENLMNFFLPFMSYWVAYALVSLLTFGLSNILHVLSYVLHKIVLRVVLVDEKTQKKLSTLHIMACIMANSQSSALATFLLFAGELVRMAFFNLNYYVNLHDVSSSSSILNDHLNYANDLTRLVFIKYIVIFGVPSALVWQNYIRVAGFGALNTYVYDIYSI